jgi:hypothetical protein
MFSGLQMLNSFLRVNTFRQIQNCPARVADSPSVFGIRGACDFINSTFISIPKHGWVIGNQLIRLKNVTLYGLLIICHDTYLSDRPTLLTNLRASN